MKYPFIIVVSLIAISLVLDKLGLDKTTSGTWAFFATVLIVVCTFIISVASEARKQSSDEQADAETATEDPRHLEENGSKRCNTYKTHNEGHKAVFDSKRDAEKFATEGEYNQSSHPWNESSATKETWHLDKNGSKKCNTCKTAYSGEYKAVFDSKRDAEKFAAEREYNNQSPYPCNANPEVWHLATQGRPVMDK